MDKKKHPIGARVKHRREEIGVSQGDLAEATGYTQTNISDIEAGKIKRPGKLKELAAALRTTDDWLLTEKGAREIDASDNSEIVDINDSPRPKNGILEIDVRVGLGAGGTLENREIRQDGKYADPVKDEAWRFPTRFMREELRATESRIIILETEGDSMTPTILSGDRVIVDTGHRLPTPDGIYALRDRYGNIVVKRLQVLRKAGPVKIKIISDNSHHPEEEVGTDEIAIVGRVLWSLKRL